MKLFITGASGFVGGAAARHLSKTHDVLAMSRSKESDAKIRATGATPVRCQLNEVTSDHLAGVDAIIHAAAHVGAWGPYDKFETLNVEATKQLLETANRAAVKRFVHISTEAVLFHGQHMRNIDENYPLALDSPFSYSRSKAQAERFVRSFQGLTRTISLRPRMVWGEGDQTVLPMVHTLADRGKFMWVNGGTAMTSTTHIDNLVHAIELSLDRGLQGSAYFVTDGAPVRFKDFMTAYAKTDGLVLPDRSMPGGLLRALARLTESIWQMFGIKSDPPITRFTAAIASRDCTLRDELAKRELGYTPVISTADGLARLAAGGGETHVSKTDKIQ